MTTKTICQWGLIAVLVLAGCGTAPVAENEGKPVTSDAGPLSTLKQGHPRLILTDSGLSAVRTLLKSDVQMEGLVERLIEEANAMLDAPTVEYKLIGPRLLSQSRACLNKVYTLALAYRLTGEKKFAERAKRELLAAASFKDWNPSHFLDTAEMSHAFGIGYDWLYDELGGDRDTVRTALIEKGLNEGLFCYRGQDPFCWWVECNHNWNQVCNGGLVIGALAIADECPELAAEIVSGAIKSLPRAMSSYAPDGGWIEGPSYWNYATSYNVYCLAALETALGKDFGLSSMAGFADTGLFRIHSIGPHGLTFNYADGGSACGPAAQMFWLARKFDRPVYAQHQRAMLRRGRPHPLDIVWFDPRGKMSDTRELPLGARFRGIEVAFFRSGWDDENALFVGFKGGNNRANHAHLDLGTFVLDANGVRWAVDLGPDDYNLPGYFGDKRWTYYRLRTDSHNTLVVNGENQLVDAKARMIAFESTPSRAFAIADLTEAYGTYVTRAHRGVVLLDRSRVLVQDEVAPKGGPREILWGMVTGADIELAGTTATLRQNGKMLTAEILSPKDVSFEVVLTTPPKPENQNEGTRRLAVRVNGGGKPVRIAVLLTPQGDAWGEHPEPALRPLHQWGSGH